MKKPTIFALALTAFLFVGLPLDERNIHSVAVVRAMEQQHSSLIPIDPSYSNDTLEYLVDESNLIFIGEVGEALGVENPPIERYTLQDGSVAFAPLFEPIQFIDIIVIDSLESKMPDRIPLKRIHDYGNSNRVSLMKGSDLNQGDLVLLFLSITFADLYSYHVRLYDTLYYVSYSEDAGIFDVMGDRTYPREPSAFRDTKARFFSSRRRFQS